MEKIYTHSSPTQPLAVTDLNETRRNHTRPLRWLAACLLLLLPAFSQAQLHVVLQVYQVQTTIGDCDGFLAGDSDPAWWWTGPGILNDECYQTTCNGCTVNPGRTIVDEYFNCPSDVPATVEVRFRGCEDDNATPACVGGVFLGICDGNAADRTDFIPIPTTVGVTNVGPFCANATGCNGQYCYWARWTVTGAFIPEDYNNDLCNNGNLGTHNINTTQTLAGQLNTSPCDDCQPGEPNCSSDPSVWYRFTTGATVPTEIYVNIDATAGGMDAWVGVYTDPANCATLNDLVTIVTNGSVPNPFGLSDVTATIACPQPNTTYYIQVDGIDVTGDNGTFTVTVSDNNVASITNDNICNATNMGIVPLGGTVTNNNFHNFCATTQAGEMVPSTFGIDKTVWFRFTTPVTPGAHHNITASNDPLNRGDQIDLQFAVYSSSNNTCTGVLTELDSEYDIPIFSEDMTLECLPSLRTFFIQVDGSALNTEGFFGLSIQDDGIAQPTNNNRCSANAMGTIPTLGQVSRVNNNNYCANVEVGEPDPTAFNLDQTVWYTFVPPASGSVEIELLSNASDNVDLQLAVWESSNNLCSGIFSEVESYESPLSNSITGGEQLRLTCLDPTKTYFIQIDGASYPWPLDVLVEGIFTLHVRDYNVSAATNDSICFPIFIGNPDLAPINTGIRHNFCADNILEPIPTAFGTNATVWFTFIAPSTGRVNISGVSDPNNVGDYIDLQLAVFGLNGNVCTGAPTEEASEYNDLLEFPPLSRNEDMFVDCLEPGRMYWLMVDGSDDPDDVDGYFRITITEAPGPPPITNDDRCTATYLGAVPAVGSVGDPDEHNFCATVEPGEPVPSAFGIDQTVWYTFLAPPTGNVTINATNDPNNYGDQIDLQVAVYESSNNLCTGTFTEVESDYDPVFFGEDVTVTCLEPLRRYWIQVDGSYLPYPLDVWVEGYFGISVTADPAFPILPTNDDICSAQSLGSVPSGGATPVTPGSNYCATEEAGEPNVSGGNNIFDVLYDETVWYTFTTNANPGTTTIDITGASGIDANIHVYQPTVWPTCAFNNLALVATGDNLLSFNVSTSIPCLEPNTTYYIQVDGNDIIGDKGTFNIRVSDNGVPSPSAANDVICAAVNLGTVPAGGNTATYAGNNMCAGEEAGEPNVSGSALITDPLYDETVWFTFTTSATPGLITVDVLNTAGINASINVYSVNPFPSCNFANLTYIDGRDDLLSNNVSLSISCLRPNTTYYVQLDGNDLVGGDRGNFDIRVRDTGPASQFAPYDNICSYGNLGTVPQGGATPTISTNNFCATEQPGEPNVSGNPVITALNYDETVWFRFTTPPNPGLTTIQVTNAVGVNANIHVYYSGAPCGFVPLVEIANADDALSNNVTLSLPCLPPNTSYYIQLDGDDVTGNYGTFDIRVTDNGAANSYPVNDNACSPISLGTVPAGGATGTVNSDNTCATEQLGEPNVSLLTNILDPNYDETLWYSFTTSATPGTVTVNVFNTTPGGLDGVINVYYMNGPCQFSTQDFIRGATTTTFGNVSVPLICLMPNTTYYVQVDGLDVLGDRGPFSINVTDNGIPTVAPANNQICNAVAMGNPTGGQVGPTAGNNNCTNQQAGEPGVNGDDETVWYTFIAPTSGRVNITVNSTAFIDANFTLYYQQPGGCLFSTLQQVGSQHDNIFNFNASASEQCLVPGGLYYIQIDGGDILGDYGNFTVTVQDGQVPFTPPSNDPCTSATPLTVQSTPCQGSGNWQVFNYGTPTVSNLNPMVNACGANCGDLWYSFVMPASGNVLIEGNDEYGFLGLNNSTLSIAAYQGSCANPIGIQCDQGGILDDPQYSITAPPGTIIYLQVFDDGGDDINESFGLCVSERCGADNCLSATNMLVGVTYCWDTDGANGENTPATPGYDECGDGSDPGHSVYFHYQNVCPTFTLYLTGNIGGLCLLDEPSDGIGVAIYQDATACDNVPDALLDCQQTDVCLGNTWVWSHAYGPVPSGTHHYIQIDGFDFTGDNNGTIRVVETCPLPAEILTFTGHNAGEVNVLDWRVEGEELTSERYVIEKSLDGSSFEAIGQVMGDQSVGGNGGQSNSDELLYTFNDTHPVMGHNYYRLRKFDMAGNETFSNIVDVMVEESKNAQIIGLYPNPARDLINVDVYVPQDGEYTLRVLDLFGRAMVLDKLQLPEGISHLSMQISEISAGVYVVELKGTTGQAKSQIKFVKQ